MCVRAVAHNAIPYVCTMEGGRRRILSRGAGKLRVKTMSTTETVVGSSLDGQKMQPFRLKTAKRTNSYFVYAAGVLFSSTVVRM